MASLNKAMIIGNVGKTPDIRHTGDGKAIANLSLATTSSWKDKATGEKKTQTEWHKVVVFGGLASVVEKHVSKGDPIYIEGKLITRKWTDKDGQDRYTTEIVVDGFTGTIQMLKQRTANDNNTPSNTLASEPPFDDEIPF